MKMINLLLAGVCLVVAGCATSRDQNRNYVPPAAVSSPSADLIILCAVYGSGSHFADVTYHVNDLIHQPGVEFFARPEWLHAGLE